jgi:predicted AlkP superfamily pyrophosphatase or phosphodiesterase
VFPTVTRVNASSYATGAYPGTHGLMGNTVYFPEVDALKGLNTGDARELMLISQATSGHLLTAPSLGEVLAAAGSRMMVFSSGSSGQAFLQNHTVSGGGMVINPELILPSEMKADVYRNLGEPPPSGKPNIRQHDWATRGFLHYGTQTDGPLVSAIWYSDPDGSAHSDGIGSPRAMESIKAVDEQFGYILKTLETKGLLDSFNIIVTADHGFATDKGKVGLQEFLISKGLKQSAVSDDVVVAGGALYVRNHDRRVVAKIVSNLQREPWVGAIFTKSNNDGSLQGSIPGTLSFSSIHWNHARAGDILVDYNWDDGENSFGYKGSSFAKGVAGHGGSSPYEVHIPLIVSGPAFR